MNGSKKISAKLWLVITIVMVALFSFLMWGFATDWGYVRSTRITIVGDDGLRYSGLMFVPENATDDNPAPAMIPLHGGSSQARDVEDWGIEMARRGFVVMVPDAAGGGQSERYNTDTYITAPVDALFKYLLTLPIVNAEEIAIVGHSQGTESTVFLTNNYIDNLACVVNICGPYRLEDDQRFETNLLTVIGSYDNVLIQGDDSIYTTGSFGNLYKTFQREGLDEIKSWTSTSDIEIGKLYGSFEDNTARMLAQVDMTHDGGRFSTGAVALLIDFIQNSTDTPRPIDPSNQNWLMKDIFGLLDILALICMFCALATVMLSTSFFASVKNPLPERVGFTSHMGWWISVGVAVFGGMAIWMLPVVQNATRSITWYSILPANQLNQAVVWMLIVAVVGVIMFGVYHITNGKKLGGSLDAYGLTDRGGTSLHWKNIGKAFILALILEFVLFNTLALIEDLTGFTPRLWNIIFSSTTFHRLSLSPMYLICYIFAFTVSALSMNIERRLPSLGSEGKDTAAAVCINALIAAAPVGILLIIQYFFGYLQMTEPAAQNALTNIVMHPFYSLPFIVGAAAAVNTYMFRKSGTIWLGAFSAALMIGINMIGNNSLKI